MAFHGNTGFWEGKSVAITGASSGIGRELAERLGRAGAKVSLIARSGERLEAAHRAIVRSGGQSAWAAADVTDRPGLAEAVAKLEARLGPHDLLIANAGVYRLTDGKAFDAEVADGVIATNVCGTINAIGAVLPGMVRRGGGHVAVVASLAGLVGLPAAGAYSAGKAALILLARSLRADLRGSGVKVTTLCPGVVDTPLITQADRDDGGVMSVADAATRILRAVERGREECGFPRFTYFLCRLLNAAPPAVRRFCERFLPRLEEGQPLTPPPEGDRSGPT